MWTSEETTLEVEDTIRECLEKVSPDPHNVFTPFALCKEVVNKIPSLVGNVLVVSNIEFIYTLRKEGVDKDNIYFATPCKVKAALAGKLIDSKHIFICEGVLDNEELQNMKFDVVVGNPPYQHANIPGNKNTISAPLWYLFVNCAIGLTKDGGTTAFITPITWIQKSNKMYNTITSNKIIHARVFSKSPFGSGVGTTVSYWIINKSKNFNGVKVHFDDAIYDLSTIRFISTKADNLYLRMGILNKTLNNNTALDVIITDVHYANQKKDIVRPYKDDTYRYPVYNTHTSSMWSRIKDDLHDAPKVILPYTGTTSRAVVDVVRSVTERGVAFPTNTISEANNLLSVIQSKLFKFVIDSVRSNATISRSVFRSLPAIDYTRSWTDQELYEHFNLTDEEIQLIEDTIK